MLRYVVASESERGSRRSTFTSVNLVGFVIVILVVLHLFYPSVAVPFSCHVIYLIYAIAMLSCLVCLRCRCCRHRKKKVKEMKKYLLLVVLIVELRNALSIVSASDRLGQQTRHIDDLQLLEVLYFLSGDGRSVGDDDFLDALALVEFFHRVVAEETWDVSALLLPA